MVDLVSGTEGQRRDPVDVCAVDDLPDGLVQEVAVNGRKIGMVRVGDSVHAFNAICPHHAGPLAKGRVVCAVGAQVPGVPILDSEKRVLMCPWHAWEFDLEDGVAVADPSLRMRVYPAEVCEGRVMVSFASRPSAR
jgi:nitrite reductase (NADH) small subunit